LKSRGVKSGLPVIGVRNFLHPESKIAQVPEIDMWRIFDKSIVEGASRMAVRRLIASRPKVAASLFLLLFTREADAQQVQDLCGIIDDGGCVLFGAPSSQASGGFFFDGINSYASYLGPPLTETVGVNQPFVIVARPELGNYLGPESATFDFVINTGTTAFTGSASLSVNPPGQPIAATVVPFTTTYSTPGTYEVTGLWTELGGTPLDFLNVTVTGAPAITTNQYASPCINPSSSCVGGSTITQTGSVSAGNLLVGTGGGTGTLTVGPATLTASSVTLGSTSEGDATVQSGGTLSAASLTVGSTAVGTLTLNDGGTVGVNGNTIVGD
jgi:hypothetical protein